MICICVCLYLLDLILCNSICAPLCAYFDRDITRRTMLPHSTVGKAATTHNATIGYLNLNALCASALCLSVRVELPFVPTTTS